MDLYLPLQHSWTWALGTIILAAVFEGLLSGNEVSSRFAELKLPALSPPLWLWIAIGLCYYVLFFAMLAWLLGSQPQRPWTPIALVLATLMLIANALWNWLFFRKKDLLASVLFFIPYVAVAVALAIALYRLGSSLSTVYLGYLIYLAYAAWWAQKVRSLNHERRSAV